WKPSATTFTGAGLGASGKSASGFSGVPVPAVVHSVYYRGDRIETPALETPTICAAGPACRRGGLWRRRGRIRRNRQSVFLPPEARTQRRRTDGDRARIHLPDAPANHL